LFHDILTELTEHRILSRYDRGVKFMKGLPKHLMIRVRERYHFNPMDPDSVNYNKCFETTSLIYCDRQNIQELDNEPSVQWSEPAQEGERPAMPLHHRPAYLPNTLDTQKKEEDDLVQQFMGLHLNASKVRSQLNKADTM
jgi:hypothetical protein